MADDQQEPRDDRARPGGQPEAPDDRGAPHHTGGSEPVGDRGGASSDGAVERPPPGDETAEQPPADETAVLPPAAGAWSGRAEVRSPDAYAPGVRGAAPEDQWTEPEAAEDRRWWLPIVIAIAALLLLGVLAYGLWLIFGRADNVPPVRPTSSALPTTAATTTSAAGSGPPTPSAAPSVTVPADVVVPRLTGLPVADARALLDSLGLSYRLEYRVTSDFVAGTVVTTNPPEGTAVPRGTKVTLVIAAAAPTTAPPPPATKEPTTPAASLS